MPKAGSRNWPDCVIGQQQGECISYPPPMARCKTSCSPDTITTDYKPKVLRVRRLDDHNVPAKAKEANVPVMACAKACTDGQRLALSPTGSAETEPANAMVATVFCTTYKLLTCEWVPDSEKDLGA